LLHHSSLLHKFEHYDHFAAFFDALKRINTIIIDLDRDGRIRWNISNKKIKAGEIGSSAMPHKVNPIDLKTQKGI
jgi:adenylosuccinate lyase